MSKSKVYVGIDNGVTGSIGFIDTGNITAVQFHIPVVKCLNYTKTKQFLNRVDGAKLSDLLVRMCEMRNAFIAIERPMVNPGRFKATMSAIRCLEATLIVIEMLGIPYIYVDSKEWQKMLLPSKLQKEELKVASMQVGQRLFPRFDFSDFDDADGLLIAEYCRRKRL